MRKKLLILHALLLVAANLLAQRTYQLRSGDLSLQVNEYGSGKPVILLAGGPGLNANYLTPVWQHYPGYRFIVPDQRGTGSSAVSKVDSAHMAVIRYVEDLEVLRKHLGLDKLTIAGHSWGGMLAMAYTAKYPDHVGKLILLGSGGATGSFFTYFMSNIAMRLRPEDFAEMKGADFTGRLRALWPGYFYDRQAGLATKKYVDSVLVGRNAAMIDQLTLSDYIKTAPARSAALRLYRGPVYIIQGRQDPTGESTVYETKEILPQSRITFIEKCGHVPWLEGDQAAKRFFDLLNNALEN
jgi:proline iminopeptidase